MMKISPLTVKALDMMMELLATMMPPWLLSVMVIRANSSHNLSDAPHEFYKASQCFTK
jgi:hypothetical protein